MRYFKKKKSNFTKDSVFAFSLTKINKKTYPPKALYFV